MPREWVTSDTHFRHKNIIEYCNRPFENTVEMGATLIKNWDECVQPEDTVWHLGDFMFGGHNPEARDIFAGLNGRKHLIIGNHDRVWVQRLGWETVQITHAICREGVKIILAHVPFDDWGGRKGGALMLHGHAHGRAPSMCNRVDVGVDCQNFTPVLLSNLLQKEESQ